MMPSSSPPSLGEDGFAAHTRAALRLLLQGREYALQSGHDVWDFAVEVADLRAAGITTNDLRWLICMGYVQHAVEGTRPQDERRVFARPAKLLFDHRSCFVLTQAGASAVRQVEQEAALPDGVVPLYDRDRRELWVASLLVKRFTQPAPDQDTILSTFQDLVWPRRIDDPLPPKHDGQDPKLHLRDAITRLNRHQQCPVIRFRGDGTGQAVLWELMGNITCENAGPRGDAAERQLNNKTVPANTGSLACHAIKKAATWQQM